MASIKTNLFSPSTYIVSKWIFTVHSCFFNVKTYLSPIYLTFGPKLLNMVLDNLHVCPFIVTETIAKITVGKFDFFTNVYQGDYTLKHVFLSADGTGRYNRNKSRLLFSSAEMFKKPLWQTVWTQIRLCSGFTLFASILHSSVMLGNYLQQTTSADDIFRCIFFLAL